MIPREGASKSCRLGYNALCTFTPYGTLILLSLVALHLCLAIRQSTPKSAR